jgi:uncharacterized membrane protein
MNKEDYLKKLSKLVKKLPEEDRKEILSDYEEHFRIGIEKGRTEEEISEALGYPENVAKQIKADYMVKKAEDKPSPTSIIEALVAVAGLGLFNILVMIPSLILGIIILSLLLAGCAGIVIGIVIMLSPLLHIFFPNSMYLPLNGVIGTLLIIGGGIFITGIGTVFVLIMAYAANWLYKFVIKLLRSSLEDIKEKTEVFK